MVDWKIWEEIYKPSTHRFIANENPIKVKMAIDNLDLPLQTKGEREIELKFPSETVFNVCPGNDFFIDIKLVNKQRFLNMMKIRYDCLFIINAKNVYYLKDSLSTSFSQEFPNIVVSLAIKTQDELKEFYALAKSLHLKHLWLNVREIEEEIDLAKCENVEYICSSGDSTGRKVTDFAWHSALAKKCEEFKIGYSFLSTGKLFKFGDKIYNIPKEKQQEQAMKASIDVTKIVDKREYIGKPVEIGGMLWKVFNNILVPIDKSSMEIRYDLLCQSKSFINCSSLASVQSFSTSTKINTVLANSKTE